MMELFILILLASIIISVAILIPVFLTTNRIYPYAYANARIRGMISSLLKKEDFLELVKKDYNEIIYYLEKKSFDNLSKYLSGDFSYGSVDSALRSQLVKTLLKIERISPEESKKFVKTLLTKYDIQIIESLVRTTNTNINNKDDVLHFTEVFSEEFLFKNKYSLNDLRNELRGSQYEKILVEHLDNIKNKKFADFEYDLDLFFFKRLLFEAKSFEAKKYVKTLIDTYNVSLEFKGLNRWIPSGTISKQNIKGKSLTDIRKSLNNKGYKIKGYNARQIERDLQIYLLNLGKKFLSKDPLSESTIIGFIIIKTVHNRNLNILLKMKSEGFSQEEISKVLAL